LNKDIEIRVIDERINSIRNKLIENIFFWFKKLPRSRTNFYLMEIFKISNVNSKLRRFYSRFKLEIVMKLPKFISYDWYLANIRTSGGTKIQDIDKLIFFTEISDDYFFSRCVRDALQVTVYVYSWDHAFKHTKFSKKVNYKTWSDGTKFDLSEMQNINLEKIDVLGATQFGYVNEARQTRKLENSYPFKYIYFACGVGIDSLVLQEIEVIKRIKKIIEMSGADLQLVVRPYPVLSDWRLYDDLKENNIFWDDSFRTSDLAINDDSIMKKFDVIKDAELFLHLGTTLGLEASFFETPSIIVDFGYKSNKLNRLSIRNFIHQSQNEKYLFGACELSSFIDEKQFINWLNLYKVGDCSKFRNVNYLINGEFEVKSFENLASEILK
jgi:hypothetical protein